MKIMKIRRVGNSNVVSLPHELESQGYIAGSEVMIEALPSGELRITPTAQVREYVREMGRAIIAENQEALDILAQDDGPVVLPSDRHEP